MLGHPLDRLCLCAELESLETAPMAAKFGEII